MIKRLYHKHFHHTAHPGMREDTTRQSVLFPDLFKKPLIVQFDQSHASSDGGAILLKACDERLGLTEGLAKRIVDKRQTGKVEHTIQDMVRQRVFAIACGYTDCNDAARLASDPIQKMLAGRDPIKGPDLASQPTLSRFENAPRRADLYRMGEELAERASSAIANAWDVGRSRRLRWILRRGRSYRKACYMTCGVGQITAAHSCSPRIQPGATSVPRRALELRDSQCYAETKKGLTSNFRSPQPTRAIHNLGGVHSGFNVAVALRQCVLHGPRGLERLWRRRVRGFRHGHHFWLWEFQQQRGGHHL